MRKIKKDLGIFIFGLMICSAVILLFSLEPVYSKTEFYGIRRREEGIKIGKTVFKMKNNKIMMQKDGNTIILVDEIINDTIAESLSPGYPDKESWFDSFPAFTDGKTLYYSRANEESTYTTIYQMNIKTEKKRALVSGEMYTVYDIGKKHIYYGTSIDFNNGSGVDSLYSLNIKTKKKHFMEYGVGRLWFVKDKVLTMGAKSEAGDTAVYLFNADGTGKKKLFSATDLFIKKGKIYFNKYNYYYKNGEFKESMKFFKCSLNGKNIKQISQTEYEEN